MPSLQEWIGSWGNLVELRMQDNNFSLLPDSIGELTQLKELYAMNNQITVLPQ